MALVKLKNVRINFANLYVPTTSPKFPQNKPKYGCTLLLDKSSKHGRASIAAMQDAIKHVLDGKKVSADKGLLIDGDSEGQHEANAGLFTVKASNFKRPTVVDAENTPLVEGDSTIYDGCFVNVALDVYYYADMKGVFATLLGVQFAGDGDPLGRRNYSADEMFGE